MKKHSAYDVFISSKSEDYPIARQIYTFLKSKGYRVFFAETEIEYRGNAAYKKTIDEALDNAHNIIVVASQSEYLTSGWVNYEWNLFATEKLSGRKNGNIMTVITSALEISDLPIGLRCYQTIKFSSYQDHIQHFIVLPGTEYPTDTQNKETDPKQTDSLQKRETSSPTIILPLQKNCEEIIINDTYHLKMLRIEGGCMEIGATENQLPEADANEFPAHKIKVNTFYMAEIPVTQPLWEMIMGYNKSVFRLNIKDKAIKKAIKWGAYGTVLGAAGTLLGATAGFLSQKWAGYELPVETVSYHEAQDFIKRLSKLSGRKFALPTEDEWEYAARGGQASLGYKYAGSNNIDEVAWYRDNAEEQTHPVKQKKANELGLYDMCGNVWEWTCSPTTSYYDKNISTSQIYRIRRGGSWWHQASNCRVSKRYASKMDKKTSGLGFRVIIRDF